MKRHEIEQTFYELTAGQEIQKLMYDFENKLDAYFNCPGNFGAQYFFTTDEEDSKTLIKVLISWGNRHEEFLFQADVLVRQLTEYRTIGMQAITPKRYTLQLVSQIIGQIEHLAVRDYLQ